jgi:hypothetical protein
MIHRDNRADIATAHSFFPNAIRRIAGGIRKVDRIRQVDRFRNADRPAIR